MKNDIEYTSSLIPLKEKIFCGIILIGGIFLGLKMGFWFMMLEYFIFMSWNLGTYYRLKAGSEQEKIYKAEVKRINIQKDKERLKTDNKETKAKNERVKTKIKGKIGKRA